MLRNNEKSDELSNKAAGGGLFEFILEFRMVQEIPFKQSVIVIPVSDSVHTRF